MVMSPLLSRTDCVVPTVRLKRQTKGSEWLFGEAPTSTATAQPRIFPTWFCRHVQLSGAAPHPRAAAQGVVEDAAALASLASLASLAFGRSARRSRSPQRLAAAPGKEARRGHECASAPGSRCSRRRPQRSTAPASRQRLSSRFPAHAAARRDRVVEGTATLGDPPCQEVVRPRRACSGAARGAVRSCSPGRFGEPRLGAEAPHSP